ncbi:unnamed protein product [Trichogramma brassicae]|uniref:Uncharacterized protein n=1 Tax=Trichogramma brassicae TaxID=86971 RepID=A0A6H5IUF3_9HYME|nr:unnamed protein product [Trichogramma brassicae]
MVDVVMDTGYNSEKSKLEIPTSKDRRGSVSSIASQASNDSSRSKKRRFEDMTDYSNVADEHALLRSIDALDEETARQLETLRVKRGFPKAVNEYVQKQFAKIKSLVQQTALENVSLRGRLEGVLLKQDQPKKSFRDIKTQEKSRKKSVPAVKVNSGRNRQPTKKYVLKMTTEGEASTTDQIKTTLQSSIDPVSEKIHVSTIRKGNSGFIFVETKTQVDLDKLMNNEELRKKGILMQRQAGRLPRMHAAGVMHDLGAMIVERGVDFALLQEPWTYGSDPVGLPSTMRRFRSLSEKAAVVVANDKIDCMIMDDSTSERCLRLDGL